MWTPSHLKEWKTFSKLLMYRPKPGPLSMAMTIIHPLLNAIHFSECLVEELSVLTQDEEGLLLLHLQNYRVQKTDPGRDLKGSGGDPQHPEGDPHGARRGRCRDPEAVRHLPQNGEPMKPCTVCQIPTENVVTIEHAEGHDSHVTASRTYPLCTVCDERGRADPSTVGPILGRLLILDTSN